MKTIEEWYSLLCDLTANTEYDVIIKKDISHPVVAIVPKWHDNPQRIAIYPKKTKSPGLVIEKDIFFNSKIQAILGEEDREHGNRPHFNNVSEHVVINVCKAFLHKN